MVKRSSLKLLAVSIVAFVGMLTARHYWKETTSLEQQLAQAQVAVEARVGKPIHVRDLPEGTYERLDKENNFYCVHVWKTPPGEYEPISSVHNNGETVPMKFKIELIAGKKVITNLDKK